MECGDDGARATVAQALARDAALAASTYSGLRNARLGSRRPVVTNVKLEHLVVTDARVDQRGRRRRSKRAFAG